MESTSNTVLSSGLRLMESLAKSDPQAARRHQSRLKALTTHKATAVARGAIKVLGVISKAALPGEELEVRADLETVAEMAPEPVADEALRALGRPKKKISEAGWRRDVCSKLHRARLRAIDALLGEPAPTVEDIAFALSKVCNRGHTKFDLEVSDIAAELARKAGTKSELLIRISTALRIAMQAAKIETERENLQHLIVHLPISRVLIDMLLESLGNEDFPGPRNGALLEEFSDWLTKDEQTTRPLLNAMKHSASSDAARAIAIYLLYRSDPKSNIGELRAFMEMRDKNVLGEFLTRLEFAMVPRHEKKADSWGKTDGFPEVVPTDIVKSGLQHPAHEVRSFFCSHFNLDKQGELSGSFKRCLELGGMAAIQAGQKLLDGRVISVAEAESAALRLLAESKSSENLAFHLLSWSAEKFPDTGAKVAREVLKKYPREFEWAAGASREGARSPALLTVLVEFACMNPKRITSVVEVVLKERRPDLLMPLLESKDITVRKTAVKSFVELGIKVPSAVIERLRSDADKTLATTSKKLRVDAREH